MRVRPRQQGSWLFPVMVVAAASVVAFGCLGLAIVTGHLRVAPPGKGDGDALVTAEALPLAKAATTVKVDNGGGGIGLGQN